MKKKGFIIAAGMMFFAAMGNLTVFSSQTEGSAKQEKTLAERMTIINKDQSVVDLGTGEKKLVIQSGQNYYDDTNKKFVKRDNKFYGDNVGNFTDKVHNDFLVRINRNSLLPYKIEKDGIYVVFEPQDVNVSQAEIIGSTAHYKNVWNNVDVRLEVTNGGIKEYLIIKSSESDSVYRYKVISNAVFFDNGNGISFMDNGKRIFSVPSPESFDKSGKKVNVSYRLYREGEYYFVEFEMDKGHEYPVVIDPRVIVEADSDIDDTYIWGRSGMEDNNYGSTYLRTGEFAGHEHILIRANDISAISSEAKIDSAFLRLYTNQSDSANTIEIELYNLRRDWIENQATWNSWKTGSAWTTPGASDTANDIYGSEVIIDTLHYLDSTYIDITDLAKKWVGKDSVHHNYGILIWKTSWETGQQHFVRSTETGSGSENPAFFFYYHLNLYLNLTALSDSSIECSVDTFEVGAVDSFIIMRSIDSSAIGDVFYSVKDTLDTLSINTNYSLIAGGYVDNLLEYYSDMKSIYTLAAVPDTPFVQSWTTKSARIYPRTGENPLNTQLAVYDSTLQKYLNSSGDTVSSAVWQTQAQWDTLISANRSHNTEYTFGIFAKNGDDSITAISELKSCKTNSTIDSFEVYAVTDSSFRIYFGGDSVYSPFQGYYVIDDSDSSVVSDTIETFSYGIKSIVTNEPFTLNSLKRLRLVRIENQADSLYYTQPDSAYTLASVPSQPTITGISDSTFSLLFDDVSGNPDSIKYAVFDSAYSLYRDTTGDTTGTIVFAVDTLWNNLTMKTYTPNLLVSLGIFAKNDDSVFTEVVSDTTWTWAAVPGMTDVSVIDSTRLLIKIDTNENPDYTYFAVEDSITGKFIDINTAVLRSAGVTADSSWAFGRYADWGGENGFTMTVTPGTQYYFRAYSKDGKD